MWLQSGGFYPSGQPMLFLVRLDSAQRALVEDRGVTASFLDPDELENTVKLRRLDRLLRLHGAERSPVDQAFLVRAHRGRIPDAVHRLRIAVDHVLAEMLKPPRNT